MHRAKLTVDTAGFVRGTADSRCEVKPMLKRDRSAFHRNYSKPRFWRANLSSGVSYTRDSQAIHTGARVNSDTWRDVFQLSLLGWLASMKHPSARAHRLGGDSQLISGVSCGLAGFSVVLDSPWLCSHQTARVCPGRTTAATHVHSHVFPRNESEQLSHLTRQVSVRDISDNS